ncbi:hypothetical protein ABIE13_002942 [Ottowia thiooxydans]|uniref:Uncharacterized protein n=1 Tax=Ottowia thiooxydans TaxID=219182 RepID=A0ABV2Q9W5_9BURK
MCARQRTYSFLLRQNRVGRKKAAPLSASLRCAPGNLWCSVQGRCGRTHFFRFALYVQTAAAS